MRVPPKLKTFEDEIVKSRVENRSKGATMNYRTAYDIFTNEPEFEALSLVSQADQLVAEDAERKSIHPADADGSGGGKG